MRSLEFTKVGLVASQLQDLQSLQRRLLESGVSAHNLSLLLADTDSVPAADLLILDEGCAVSKLSELQQNNRLADTAVVIMGGDGDTSRALQLIELGAQDYISKDECRPELLKRSLLHALERHHLRAQLISANRRLEKVIHANLDGCLVITKEGSVVFANPAAEAIMSRPGKQLIGSQLGIPVVDHDYANIELVLPDSRMITAELRVTDVEWDGEDAYLVSLRDVTERKSLQERELRYQARIKRLVKQLSESEDRERRRLARILHDDVQHSLLSAKLALQAIEESLEDETTRTETSDAASYIDEAINTSRTLTSELTPTILDDRGLVAALQWLARLNKKRSGTIVEIDADHGLEVSDTVLRGFIFQAIRELLLNIVKHARGAKATIQLRLVDDNRISISVQDNGPGFDLAVLESNKPDVGGFGLFHMQQQAENLGGNLSIESSPGKGSRFSLAFALTRDEPRLDEARIKPKSRDKTSVLIIDDQKSFRFLFKKMLEKTGLVEVIGVAGTGKEGLDLVEQLMPDLVLCDVSLPDIEGPELVRQLVASQPELRIIACSMHEPEEMAGPMCDAGAETYLRKDVSVEAFRRAISRN